MRMHGRSTHPGPTNTTEPGPVKGPPQPPARRAVSPGERTTSPGATTTTVATLPHRPLGCAVVHLGRVGARVARDHPGGSPEIVAIGRRSRARMPVAYLARVLEAVGDRAPVVIAGLADERAALEEEIVRRGRDPERFIEDPLVDSADEALRGRLRELHSHPG
jgi:hypothetical protein